MNTLRDAWKQFVEMFGAFTPSQRGTLIAVPLMVLAGFAMLLWNNTSSSKAALSWGKVFSTEELIAAEQALLQANLTEFERQGQRLLVPATEVDRYNAALLEFDAMPADLGSQMLKQLESMGPFSTERQRQDLKEAMLLQEVRRTLRAVPEVEDARVVVATPARRGPWGPRGRVTANVTIKPRGNRELSSRLVASIRAAVAGMVPDLQASDVTVFDVLHQTTYSGEQSQDPFSSQLLQRLRELTREYEQQIAKDLAYIPSVGVTVHVDIENLKSSVIRTQQIDPKQTAAILTQENTSTDSLVQKPPRGEAGQAANRPASLAAGSATERTRQMNQTDSQTLNGVSFEITEKELIAAMPKAVQVSISVPREYYRNVAAARTARGETDAARVDVAAIEKEVLATVEKSVVKLIPAGSPPDSVSVSSIDLLPSNDDLPPTPWSALAYQYAQQYGGSALLILMTLWIVRTIRKSLPASAPLSVAAKAETNEADLRRRLERAGAGMPDEPVKMEASSPRDRLQLLVRDNPETTAAVIGKWLQAAS